ncbi:MAG: ATP synthase F1 subunit delta [Nitrospinota bacterium]|jgi:F-type H+-transporting ATPase subunit delta|nr:ATP synthase F1 subunit delta [Nitrospinota bacterium]
MIENQIGKRFAEALSEAVTDDKRLQTALENLRWFQEAFQTEPNLNRFFSHPAFPQRNKAALVKEMCDRVSALDEVRNLLKLLVDRNKMMFLKNITEFFEHVVAKRLKQVRVNVVSAYPLSDEQLSKLHSALERILGKSAIIDVKVDEDLIGGLRLSVGSLVADATIKNSLALLKRSIEQEEAISES